MTSDPPTPHGASEIDALRRRLGELERREAEHERTATALRESEATVRALLESASEGIVVADAEGRIVLVNARAEAMFGYGRQELIGQSVDMLVPEELRATHAHHRKTYAADPRVRPMGQGRDLVARRRDGTTFPVEISLSFASTRAGVRFMAFVSDISARKRAEEALRRSELRASALLEAASEGVVVVDRQGRIVSVNRHMGELFGHEPADLIGQSLEVLLPERLREVHAQHRRQYFDRPRVRSMGRGLDLIGRRRDGSEFPVEISLSFIETEEGLHALGFITDISGRLAVDRATRQAERLAALGTLAAGMAHEINNPIGIMTSRIELMRLEAEGHGLSKEVVDDLEVLHRSAQRVARIGQRLLSFARESPGERMLVDLNRVVEEALLLTEPQLARDGLRVITRLDPAPPVVIGHQNALVQVVLNLVTNAAQAMERGGELSIETRIEDDRVRLEVTDTGSGIAPDVLSRIFDPFYTTKASGTGLGLSVSYGIIQDHAGTVDVRSEPGRGTTFVLTFPAVPRSRPTT